MALPDMTPEQRKEALAKATKVRSERAKMKKDISTGKLTFKKLLKKLDSGDQMVAKTKVSDVIISMPGIGKVRRQSIMESVGISDTRRMAGLGTRQREKLSEIFA